MKHIIIVLISAGVIAPSYAAVVKPTTAKATIAKQVSTTKKANIELGQAKSSTSKNSKTAGVFQGGVLGSLGDVFDNPWIQIAANVGTVVAATQGEDTLAKYLLATGNIGNIMDVSRDVMSGNVDLNTVIQGSIAAGSIYAITSDSNSALRNMGIANTLYSAQDMGTAAAKIMKDQYGIDPEKYGIKTGDVVAAGQTGGIAGAASTVGSSIGTTVSNKVGSKVDQVGSILGNDSWDIFSQKPSTSSSTSSSSNDPVPVNPNKAYAVLDEDYEAHSTKRTGGSHTTTSINDDYYVASNGKVSVTFSGGTNDPNRVSNVKNAISNSGLSSFNQELIANMGSAESGIRTTDYARGKRVSAADISYALSSDVPDGPIIAVIPKEANSGTINLNNATVQALNNDANTGLVYKQNGKLYYQNKSGISEITQDNISSVVKKI